MDFFFLEIVKAFFAAKRVDRMTRAKVERYQQHLLNDQLLFTWDHSPFYHKLWSEAGIKREELIGINMERLPVVNKKLLMDNFQAVITEKNITRDDVEQFIKTDPTGKKWYKDRFVAMNTSGSSGVVGVFLYTKEFWARLMGVVAARMCKIPLWYFPAGKARVGFVGETSGHHAGISIIKAAPPMFHAASIDVDQPKDALKRMLEAHNPNILVGYASGIAELADFKITSGLNIVPKVIITSGEALSPAREQIITKAFGVRPFNFYGATECLAMGASITESGKLDIFDDLLYLEAVDDQGKPVAKGELGRVVITVLANTIFPLIRYAIDDEITLDPESPGHRFLVAETVAGRKMDRMIVKLHNGKTMEVHPLDLVGLFFPGLKHYQVVQTGESDVSLRCVVEGDHEVATKDANVLIDEFLKEKMLTRADLNLTIEFVDNIPPDPITGKTPIIVPLKKPVPSPIKPELEKI
jgi:phenylacetate-CoA ligase